MGKQQTYRIRSLLYSRNHPIRAAFLFGFASLASWMPLFNVWLEDAGLAGIQIGYVAAIPWIVMLILQPVWGIIADRYGKYLCLRMSLLFAIVFFVTLPFFSKGITTIAIFTFMLAVFNTPILPLLDSIALDHVDTTDGITYSNIRFWGAPGYGLGALLTGWLIPLFGVQVAFFTGAAFLLFLLLSIRKYHPGIISTKSIEIEFRGLNKVISDRVLILFLVIIFLVAISQSAITLFLTLYMRQIGASPEITGTAISIQAFSELPFYFIAAWLLRKVRPNRIVLIAIFGTAIRLFFYSINDNPGTVLFIETMNGITWTLLWIASVEFINEMVPVEWRTTGQSLLWAAYFGAGSIMGSIINGRLYEQMEMQKVYSINSLGILMVAILAAVLFLLGKKKKKHHMVQILSRELAEEMFSVARKIVRKKGISTRNEVLLQHASKTETLAVKNNRIYPSEDILGSCMEHIKKNTVPVEEGIVNNHGWLDMIINSGDDIEIVIKLTDLPFQFCDHQHQDITPLSRKNVIEGTKLIHVLSVQDGIKGYSCGVPQDTHPHLKAIEQYLIGYRYNQNGGGTIQSIFKEVESEYSLIRSIAEDWENPGIRDLMLFSPSPMILDADELYLCFQDGITLNRFMVGSMPMMGMTGPIDPIGVYILGMAEVLGAATVLHALFPDAKAYVYPHPQAMSLHTGQMAFGTVEHARLEMMKRELMDVMGLPYYNLKDIMTSAQMPGFIAQGDKALGFYSGIMAGYRAFNLMPLSTDQVWSPEQALLDLENLQNAWKVLEPVVAPDITEYYQQISNVMDANILFSESEHTLLHMHEHYDLDILYKRHFASETWMSSGKPDEITAVEAKKDELISVWDYRPPQQKLEQIIDVYTGLCKRLDTEPLNLD